VREAAASLVARRGGSFDCFVAQNPINFTKFDYGFSEIMLMTKALIPICTENGAEKITVSPIDSQWGRGNDGDAGAIVIRNSIMV
jgi:hypothetical protein